MVGCTGLHQQPPVISMAAARAEAEMVMFDAVEQALASAKLTPKQVLFVKLFSISEQSHDWFSYRCPVLSFVPAGQHAALFSCLSSCSCK